ESAMEPIPEQLPKIAAPVAGKPWTNTLGMKFAPVGEALFSIWETRVSDYRAFCNVTGRGVAAPDFPQDETHPVVKVSRKDAMAFCDWLTEKELRDGALREGQSYRLPTDSEWSAAVGLPPENGSTPALRDGAIKDEYPWGKKWPPPNGAGNYAERATEATAR